MRAILFRITSKCDLTTWVVCVRLLKAHAAWDRLEVVYEVHSMMISPGYRDSDFAGKLRTQKLNKAQTKRADTTGAQNN